MKWYKYILPICFILLCFSLFWGSIIRGEVKDLYLEKRPAALLPKEYESQKIFAQQFEKYVNDQLLLRNTFIRIKSAISIFIYKISPFPDLVVIGENNWLFFKADNSLKTYKSDTLFTEKELAVLTFNLLEKKIWLNKRGIKFYVLIAPSKPEIYSDFLPQKWKRKSEIGVYDQLKNYLTENSDINIVFPKNELEKEKTKQEVYYKFDTHWNTHGAYTAYYELIKKIKEDFPNMPDPMLKNEIKYTYKTKNDFDLLRMINLPNTFNQKIAIPTQLKYEAAVKTAQIDYPGLSIFPGEYYASENKKKPKMLMFRDSYSVALVPYLNCHFSKASYIWSPLLTPSTVVSEKPDIVILELTQRRVKDLFIPNDSILRIN